MPEESTTPDLVELTRRVVEASNHGEVDSALAYFAPDAVWSVGPGLEQFEGKAAIRRFWTEWGSTTRSKWRTRSISAAVWPWRPSGVAAVP